MCKDTNKGTETLHRLPCPYLSRGSSGDAARFAGMNPRATRRYAPGGACRVRTACR
jgi:hypothetical protein